MINPNVKIQKINSDEIETIFNIDQELFEYDFYPLKTWNEMWQNGSYEIVGIKVNEMIAGFLCLYHGLDEDEIIRIGVSKQFQGQKLGFYLMEYALKSPKKILLEVSSINTKAISLYEKTGFRIIGTRKQYYHDGSDAIIMEKSPN